eukprot:m.11132 g.11132  ORF g.11132 m.11132 type:complete len:508 (-) comp5671_c0_seq1:415-1938(-)
MSGKVASAPIGGGPAPPPYSEAPVSGESFENPAPIAIPCEDGEPLEPKGFHWRKLFPMEGIMFLYMMAIQLGGPAGNELVQNIVCEMDKQNHAPGSDQPNYCNSKTVTGEASHRLFYLNLAMVVPSFFVVTTLGALSDKYGRRIMMFLPCVGSLLQQLGILLVMYLDLHINWLYLPMVLYGIFGTYALFLMSLFSGIADITNAKTRTVRIGFMEGMNLAGACAGMYAGGAMSKNLGYKFVFWFLAGVYVVIMLYILAIKEPLPRNRRKERVTWMDANIVSVLAIFVVRGWRLFLLGFAFMVLMTTQVGYQIVIMYLKQLFNWEDDVVGRYLAATKACYGFSVLIVLPIIVYFFGTKAKDYPLAQLSVVVMTVQYVLWALFRESGVMFAITTLGLLSGLAAPICRAMLSKSVPSHEQGLVFSAVGALEVLTGLTGPAIFNNVYSHDAKVHPDKPPNNFLWVAAGLSGLVFFLFLTYAMIGKKHNLERLIAATENQPLLTQDQYTVDSS